MKSRTVHALLALMAVGALAASAFGMTPGPTIELPGRVVTGLALDSGFLWAAHLARGVSDTVTISKLNPVTGATVLSSPELLYNGRGICVGDGSLWITDALNDRVHRLDPNDFREIASFPTPGTEPCGLTFDGTYLWLTDPWYNTIYKLTTDGSVVGSCTIPNAYRLGLEWADGGVWTPTDSTTISHYTPGCTVDSTIAFPLPGGTMIFDVATDDGNWYLSSQEHIYVFDSFDPSFVLPGRYVRGIAADSRLLWAVHSEEGESDTVVISALSLITGAAVVNSPELPYNGRGICLGAGSLWISDALHDRVHRLDPNDLHEISSFPTPGTEPCGITFDGTYLWLTDPWYHKIYKLATDGNVVGFCPIPNEYHFGLEWAEGGAWAPTDSTTISHYLPDCTVDRTIPLTLRPGTYVFDVATSQGRWYASCRSRIYEIHLPGPSFVLPGRVVTGLAFDSGFLWAAHLARGVSDIVTISKLDPVTGATVLSSPELLYNGRGICVGDGSLWITDALNDRVHRLDPNDFHEIASFPTPGTEPCGLTFDGTYLWLTDPWYNTIYKLTTDGSVVGSCTIPDAYRCGLEWADGGVWTPTDSTTISHYLPDCSIDRTITLPLPDGTSIVDIALAVRGWYASSGENIYMIPADQLPTTDADGIGHDGGIAQMTLRLNGPSPMRHGTSIAFDLPRTMHVRVEVVDVAGRVRAILKEGLESAGSHSISWNGCDSGGHPLASGVYFLRLQSGRDVRSRKVVVAR